MSTARVFIFLKSHTHTPDNTVALLWRHYHCTTLRSAHALLPTFIIKVGKIQKAGHWNTAVSPDSLLKSGPGLRRGKCVCVCVCVNSKKKKWERHNFILAQRFKMQHVSSETGKSPKHISRVSESSTDVWLLTSHCLHLRYVKNWADIRSPHHPHIHLLLGSSTIKLLHFIDSCEPEQTLKLGHYL